MCAVCDEWPLCAMWVVFLHKIFCSIVFHLINKKIILLSLSIHELYKVKTMYRCIAGLNRCKCTWQNQQVTLFPITKNGIIRWKERQQEMSCKWVCTRQNNHVTVFPIRNNVIIIIKETQREMLCQCVLTQYLTKYFFI